MSNTIKRGQLPRQDQLVIVAGAGRSGVAAARLLRKMGIAVRLTDKNPGALSEQEQLNLKNEGVDLVLGNQDGSLYRGASFVVASPGIPIKNIEATLEECFHNDMPEIMSEMELAWRCLENESVLAITGTSGKTTTASLCAAMLEAGGNNVFLGGNIGTPLSEYVLGDKRADVLVLEASSFQLQGCSTFRPHVGILLNITPNHLDYHKDMAEYAEAKLNMFRMQEKEDLAIFGENTRPYLENFPVNSQVMWLGNDSGFDSCRLPGKHNRINIEAAWLACHFLGVQRDCAEKVAADFSPLEHRLEFVGEIDGTLFVNDSKCTTVSSLQVALESFDRPIRLLCGGKFKGGDLSTLNGLIRSKVCEVALFGASREKFEQQWSGLVPIHWYPNLEDAMYALNKTRMPNDVILLSPATSSFDQYSNYEERGEHFKKIFRKLNDNPVQS